MRKARIYRGLEKESSFFNGLYISMFQKSLWVPLFLLLCYGVHWKGMCKKKEQERDLKTRYGLLQKDLHAALQQREEYLNQIQSQKDPRWIEMMLMKELGVVPDGQTKVYFKKD